MSVPLSAVAVLDAWVERVELLARRCASARDIETLVELAGEARAVAVAMLEADVGAALVARTQSAMNDALTVRILHLAALRRRLPTTRWCWMAFGSEGRAEQTFFTDQDNGIVFGALDAAEARALRPSFMAFAGDVNDMLAACGFPLCTGGVMARNEQCCMSLEEWQAQFYSWIRLPEPQALLNATIFFDFRALHGDATLVDALRARLAMLAVDAEAFLRMMATNALEVEPPVGFLRDLVGHDSVLDLKKFGTRLFVDAARIVGLAAPGSGTVERLRFAAAAGTLPRDDAESSIDAFHVLQQMRLQRQRAALGAGEAPGNLVDSGAIPPFQRQMLQAALKQARLLQQRLKITFRLDG